MPPSQSRGRRDDEDWAAEADAAAAVPDTVPDAVPDAAAAALDAGDVDGDGPHAAGFDETGGE